MFILIILYVINIINCILEYKFIQKKFPINIFKKYNIDNLYKNITNNNKTLRKLEYIELNTISSYENVFTIKILIGSNKEEFNVIFDTGSIILWIAGKDSDDKYPMKHHFDYKNSTTFYTDYSSFSVIYGSGSCSGIYGNDNIYINENKYVSLNFGIAKKTEVNFNDLADGIVGIGKYYNDKNLNFIGQLKEQNIIEKNIFSVKTFLNNTGILYIGDEHQDFNNTDYNKIIPNIKLIDSYLLEKNYWTGTLQYITIGNRNKKNYRKNSIPIFSNVIFDTGTTLNIINDKYLLNDILNMLSNENNCIIKRIEGIGIILCENINNMPNISFTFDGYSFIIPNQLIFNDSAYIINDTKIDKKYKYFCNILCANMGVGMSLIGMPFFQTYHVLFDNDKNRLKVFSENNDYILNVKNMIGFFSDINLYFVYFIFILVIGGMLYLSRLYYYKMKFVDKIKEYDIQINNVDNFLDNNLIDDNNKILIDN